MTADPPLSPPGTVGTVGARMFSHPCHFIAGAGDEAALPPPVLPEVAFAGRSNVGKSTLINALTRRKTLARTSRTPGRTRQINFFALGQSLCLVDLPGYGYARASKRDIGTWTRLTRLYLKQRATLRRVCLLVDSRHGLKPPDIEAMEMLDQAAQPYRIILTKADAITPPARAETVARIADILQSHPAALSLPLAVSARSGLAIADLREDVATLA